MTVLQRSTRLIAVGMVLAVTLLAGCGSSGRALQTIPAARAAVSPAQTSAPAGTVTRVGAVISSAVVEVSSRTVVLAVDSPDRLLLFDAGDLSAPPRTVALAGRPTAVTVDGTSVLVALPGAVLRVDPRSGSATSTPVDGEVRSVVGLAGGQVAVGLASGVVQVVSADGAVAQTVSGLAGVDGLVQAGGVLVALDRAQTAVSVVDPAAGKLGEALRAGEGATNMITDSFDRALVTDTTGGALLAFSTGALMLRQRYPVPGAPYALAYDPKTALVWVTLTARNQVVGYDVRGGEPVERYRFDTLTQPDSVAVDSAGGAVLVGSATGEGLQRIQPGVAP